MAQDIKIYSMENMKKAYAVSATNEVTGHEKENAMDWNPDTYWKHTGVGADIFYNFDLVDANPIDYVGFWIHNYKYDFNVGADQPYQYYFQYWTGSAWQPVSPFGGIVNIPGTPIFFVAIDEVTESLWRIYFYPNGSVTDTIEISMVFLMKEYDLGQGNEYPEPFIDRGHNRIKKMGGGRMFTKAINNNNSRRMPFLFSVNTAANFTALSTPILNSNINRLPLILQQGTTNDTADLVHIAGADFNQNKTGHNMYRPTVIFETVPYIEDGENL